MREIPCRRSVLATVLVDLHTQAVQSLAQQDLQLLERHDLALQRCGGQELRDEVKGWLLSLPPPSASACLVRLAGRSHVLSLAHPAVQSALADAEGLGCSAEAHLGVVLAQREGSKITRIRHSFGFTLKLSGSILFCSQV